jgi:signal transduction histidine kinase
MTSTQAEFDAWPEDPGERLARVVHDVRTPLTIIGGFADMLVRRPDMDEEQRNDFIARIADAARDMRAILDSERADRGV